MIPASKFTSVQHAENILSSISTCQYVQGCVLICALVELGLSVLYLLLHCASFIV